MNIKEINDRLKEPFGEENIQWRVQSCGISASGKPWVMVIPYVSARAIQDRLDEVFNLDGWKDKYRDVPDGVICTLSVKIDGKWISKENGSSKTQVNSFKGGISGAFKRVASSGFGIGRYLYNVEEAFAECTLEKPSDNIKTWSRAKYKKDDKTPTVTIYWKNPQLSDDLLPKKKPKDNNDIPSIAQLSELCTKKGVTETQLTKSVKTQYFKESLKQLSESELSHLFNRISEMPDQEIATH